MMATLLMTGRREKAAGEERETLLPATERSDKRGKDVCAMCIVHSFHRLCSCVCSTARLWTRRLFRSLSKTQGGLGLRWAPG